jgi:hypothetical protein
MKIINFSHFYSKGGVNTLLTNLNNWINHNLKINNYEDI